MQRAIHGRTSLTSCVTYSVVSPRSAWSLRAGSTIVNRVATSTADVGSSISKIRGSCTNARAMRSRCCCPPDRCPATWSAEPISPTETSATSTRRRSSVVGFRKAPSVGYNPIATASRTLIGNCGSGARLCGTYPIWLRARTRSRPEAPRTVTLPDAGVTKPRTARSNVVLPEPFGPIMPRDSPGLSSKLTSSMPTDCWYATVTWSNRTEFSIAEVKATSFGPATAP